jgi:hypothetical protein
MSCLTSIDPATGQVTHNYTGNVTVDLTSASNGGAGYVAPTCDGTPPTTDQFPSYTVQTSINGVSHPVAAPEFDWYGAPAMLAIAVMSMLMLKAQRRRTRAI